MTVVSRQNHHCTLVPPAISSGVQQQQQQQQQQRHNLRLSSIAKTTTMVKRNDQLLLLIITILTGFSITYSPVYKSLLYSVDHYYYTQEEVAAERELLSEPTTTIQGTPAGSVTTISSSSYYPFTKVGNVHSTKTISRRRKLNRQYSITRYTTTSSNNNNNNNSSTVTYHNTIPESMMLLDGKLLWCPNAKAGTTSMYEKIIFPTKIMNNNNDNNDNDNNDPRCYDDCSISAWKKFDKSEYKRNLVMEAPSFTVVRNPWDRLKSSYNNKIRTQILIPTDDNPRGFVTKEEKEERRNNKDNNNKQLFPKKIMTFQQYVNHVEKYPNANRHWQPHSTKCMLTKTSSNNNNNDTNSGSNNGGGVFHYDYIIKLEDHGGLFPQIYKLFDMYKLPFPNEMKKELDDKSSSSGSNNNNNNKSSLLLLDESLLKFYNEAASVESGGNGNINDLVKQVGRIYYDDVRLHNYSFPNNNNFLEESRDE